jgi:hypothetical protein
MGVLSSSAYCRPSTRLGFDCLCQKDSLDKVETVRRHRRVKGFEWQFWGRRALEHTFGGQYIGICLQEIVPRAIRISLDVAQRSKASLVGDQQQVGTLFEKTSHDFKIGRRGPACIVQLEEGMKQATRKCLLLLVRSSCAGGK